MNRRGFIQISAVAVLPVLLGLFPRRNTRNKAYTIDVRSNRSFGHLLRSSSNVSPSSEISTDYIIVGGGVAGVAAATVLKDENFMLFEGDDRLGGSSASYDWKTTRFATGAHYELAYPTHFGKEVIDLLTRLDVLKYNSETELHEFVDKQYVIKSIDMEQCFSGEDILEDVLSEVDGIEAFYEALTPFEGKMHLPTRLIAPEYHYLNELTFKEFLESKIDLSADLERRISYQMLDDWGGKCNEVSALAGIHYYTCRPYNTQNVQLFSPPNGNSYFVEKMIGQITDPETLKTNSLIRMVRETEEGIEAEVLNRNGEVQLVKAKGLIYAGQKHALKYILRSEEILFSNSYAPWVVLNIICKKGANFEKWQNDVLTDDLNFLGFVNSSKQKVRNSEFEVLTAYYCFDDTDRETLVTIEKNPKEFVDATIALIEEQTGTELEIYVEHVVVNLLGHAMPIPKPGYMSFQNVPQFSDKIIFAGVDTGRLPLFYEACDSGLQAAKQLLDNQNKKLDL